MRGQKAESSKQKAEIRAGRLVLVPVSWERAESIVRGDLAGLRAAEGWPHADTVDGLRMAAAGGADAWLVTLDGVVIGDCGTHGPPDAEGDVEVGFGLAESQRGRGHGSEVAAGLSAWLLRRPGVRRVVAREVLADNVPSRRALERAGFALERDGEDHVSYALGAA
jgi:RimJ/RimL family protein N-acetyltransferase